MANQPIVYLHRTVYREAVARETNEQLIQAADALFYGEGLRSASMERDRGEGRRDQAHRILYRFPSKDDLIAAYLTARDEPTFARQAAWLDETKGICPSKSSDYSKIWLGR